jgi:hypothetical protein
LQSAGTKAILISLVGLPELSGGPKTKARSGYFGPFSPILRNKSDPSPPGCSPLKNKNQIQRKWILYKNPEKLIYIKGLLISPYTGPIPTGGDRMEEKAHWRKVRKGKAAHTRKEQELQEK